MITLAQDDLKALIAEARLAPSVHNIQPSRWRQTDGGIELLGDPSRSIPVADPQWRDWRLSHGAALEGLAIALAGRGLRIAQLDLAASGPQPIADSKPIIARLVVANIDRRPEAEPTATRASWRGSFKPVDAETRASLDRLSGARNDVILVRDPDAISAAASLGDQAGLYFMRDAAHRKELLAWLRLDRSHANYRRDGLSAEAMSLSSIEAWGAGMVLGPLFQALDRVGLAAPLVSERAKTKSSAALVLFHRPKDEDAFGSGRAFYRVWLEMERQGLQGCPISVLADWAVARDTLTAKHGVPEGRQIVSVFRIGRPKGTPRTAHSRLPVDELLV
jgi:nitroreductase